MTSKVDLLELDHRYVWHPYIQMKDFEKHNPLFVDRADGVFLREPSVWQKNLKNNLEMFKTGLRLQIFGVRPLDMCFWGLYRSRSNG
jgi:hypothetical protein